MEESISNPKAPSFWSSRGGSWTEVALFAVALYLISFTSLVIAKPAFVLKAGKKETEKDKEKERTKERERGMERTKLKRDMEMKESECGNVSGISNTNENENTFMQMTEVLCEATIGSVGNIAIQEAMKRFGKPDQIFDQLRKTKANKCWESQEIDWGILSACSCAPSCFFLLLVVAAI